ncbi:STAS domain-containing protein [Pseudonocardia hispaniensis]|uniref:STAS domain-containing protein n=1 Tax=Pseudonocardia hispaniensis TaxID=904933 RepID=A0ABW1J5J7_9PSEU
MSDVSVDIEPSPDAIRIAVSGEIDLANAAIVEHQLLDAITNQVTAVSVDFSNLSYIDSAGLRVLFALGARLDTLQIAFELVVPPGSLARRAIELSGVAAVAALRPGTV